MRDGDTYIVTKIEAADGRYRVTAKDADDTKAKRRNVTVMEDDATKFQVGSLVKLRLV